MKRKSAFTLIELLVVILIIGFLMGLISSALLKARENAKRKLDEVTRKTLESAISNYRHEYGKWPVPGNPTSTVSYAANNYVVLDMMLSKDEDKNKRQIRFINLGEYYTYWKGKRYLLSNLWNIDRNDNQYKVVDPWNNPYLITFDLNNDSVVVTNSIPPGGTMLSAK